MSEFDRGLRDIVRSAYDTCWRCDGGGMGDYGENIDPCSDCRGDCFVRVTHVMSEADALACFPQHYRSGWWPGPAVRPSCVRWIVVAEPFVCPTCDGDCFMMEPDYPCRDCNGTGLPDVEILTTGAGLTEYEAGVVTIGAAVPIVEQTENGDCPDSLHICIFYGSMGGQPFNQVTHYDGDTTETDITDQFGSQAVTPGHYAHPILSSPDGTDAATTAA